MLITAFKGFDKDLKCRDFQYEIGKEYSEETASLCNKGFHACENPIDVFSYYSPAESRYCEVALDATDEKDGDSKRCGKQIHIKTEIGLKGIIEAAIKFTFGKTEWKEENSTTGDQAGAQATGDRAGAQATGDQAGAQATGDRAGAQATGYRAGAQATGDRAGAQATGDRAGAQATGDQAGAQATGYRAGAQATGYQAGAQATGDRAGAQATGYRAGAQATGIMAMATANGYESSVTIDGAHAIGCGLGYANKIKGALGSWLVLAERGNWDGKCYPIRTVKTAQVDGEKIKTDTFYMLKNGNFVEA